MLTLSGHVEKIIYRNIDSSFTVVRFRPVSRPGAARRSLPVVVGHLPEVRPGDSLLLVGDWERHPRYGTHFRVQQYSSAAPRTEQELLAFLSSEFVKGVGPRQAQAILDHFGTETARIIEEEPERLSEVKGIGTAKARSIAAARREQQTVARLAELLREGEAPPNLAVAVQRIYGEEALQVVSTDPYRLAEDVSGVGFGTADSLARHFGLPSSSLRRTSCGLRYVLGLAADDGHLFLLRRELEERAQGLLGADGVEVSDAIEELRRRRQIVVVPAIMDTPSPARSTEDRVYLLPLFLSEHGLAHRLMRLQRLAVPELARDEVDALIQRFQSESGIILNAAQTDSVWMGLSSKVALLTGGPGTGKTTTLRALTYVLEELGRDYALTAPTGRAAKRLSEVTGREASTIHRLLGYSPVTQKFAYREAAPLPRSFVVVEETSMLDSVLANQLVRALRPDCQILFVGDADQLPSVGPGSVLRDLILSERLPEVRLTELFRQAASSDIVVNAHRINAGLTPQIVNRRGAGFYLLPVDTPEAAAGAILDLVERRLPRAYGLDARRDIQVLSPVYAGPAGVDHLNALLQARLNPHRDPRQSVQVRGGELRVGDKVMQLRSDYVKAVFNGDVGIIRQIEPVRQQLIVEFPTGHECSLVTYQFWELGELTLAYATSVHKSQGCEYPVVVLAILPEHYRLLQRNVLYTAITRAQEVCVLVGAKHALELAVRRHQADQRNTGLADLLKRIA